jgi:hypothetical protein
MRAALLLVCLTAAAAGCSPGAADRSVGSDRQASSHGLTVDLPDGWHLADRNLNPVLAEPSEVLAVTSFPAAPGTGWACFDAPAPGRALQQLGATGVLLELEEYHGLEIGGFGARPASFRQPATQIACQGRFDSWWIPFADNGRYFYALLAIGTEAPAADVDRAWRTFDSLRVGPEG